MKGEIKRGGDVGSDASWVIILEAETEAEKCALEYLSSRPKNNFEIWVDKLGTFISLDLVKA